MKNENLLSEGSDLNFSLASRTTDRSHIHFWMLIHAVHAF